MMCRRGFHYVVHANEQLISILRARGPQKPVDIDNAASRITLDVIGRVGFDKDFGATQSLDDSSINRAFDLMTAGGHLCRLLREDFGSAPSYQHDQCVSSSQVMLKLATCVFAAIHAGRDEGLKRYRNGLRKYCTFIPVGGNAIRNLLKIRQYSSLLRLQHQICLVQSVRKGEQDFRDFRQIMSDLLAEIKARGPPKDSDVSVAAHLLRIKHPATGRPIPDDRIAAEIGVLFTGGFETTGHTIAWAMCFTYLAPATSHHLSSS